MQKIFVNGIEKEVNDNYTINDILNELKINGSFFVVEKNLEIVHKEQYGSIVACGDKFEIVSLCGGG